MVDSNGLGREGAFMGGTLVSGAGSRQEGPPSVVDADQGRAGAPWWSSRSTVGQRETSLQFGFNITITIYV
jgi:hypothetical protein